MLIRVSAEAAQDKGEIAVALWLAGETSGAPLRFKTVARLLLLSFASKVTATFSRTECDLKSRRSSTCPIFVWLYVVENDL